MDNPAEVQELRNKLRMMKFPQDEILNTVRRQQRAIHKQKQANETIRNEINEYEKQIEHIQHEIHLHKTDENLQKLQTMRKNLSNKLSLLTADVNAEEAKKRKLEEEVSKENSKAGGFFQQSRENEQLQARCRTMENRLDKALVRYSKNLTKLAEIRSRIDELRKERFAFKEIIRTAEVQKDREDQEITRLISNSNEAYSERDRKNMETLRLKTAEKTDIKAFEEKLARLNQTIEGQKISQSHPPVPQQPLPSMSSQLGSQLDQDQEGLVQMTEQYQIAIDRTLDIMEMKDIEELFDEAERIERENFSLYNFVVEQGATRTKLQDEIDGLELQRDSLLAQREDNELEQSEELQELTGNIQEVDMELADVRHEKEKNMEAFASIYKGIESMFNMLECKWSDSPDGKAGISPTNAMFCLSSIETAVADMMNSVLEKTKLECNLRDIKPLSFIQGGEQSPQATMTRQLVTSRVVQEKELAGKVADSTKPLSIEEMMAMLE